MPVQNKNPKFQHGRASSWVEDGPIAGKPFGLIHLPMISHRANGASSQKP
jgi:hypothetical protein